MRPPSVFASLRRDWNNRAGRCDFNHAKRMSRRSTLSVRRRTEFQMICVDKPPKGFESGFASVNAAKPLRVEGPPSRHIYVTDGDVQSPCAHHKNLLARAMKRGLKNF